MDDSSAEVLFDRTCRAVTEGDLAFWSATVHPDALVVGSAPGEVYRGREAVLAAFAEYGPIACTAANRSVRDRGDACWCFGDVSVAGVDARMTLVAERRDDAWSITHWHLSVAVPDEEVFGA
jgi:hypothetical protein